MSTSIVGQMQSDLEPSMTVEQRYQKRLGKPDSHQRDMQGLHDTVSREGWHPDPLEIKVTTLTDGHHRYAEARNRGIDQLPVTFW